MSLTPGRSLDHYVLVETIGEGGMGVVWRATDSNLGRDVAIKVLPAVFADDPERMARFEREARLLASLNHPGIASIYGVGSNDGVRFLAMELVQGDDLAVRLSHGALPVVEALEYARQIAAALEAAHEKGVIHRDLKPANVKATPEGQIKLLDFGLAKALESEPEPGRSSQMSHSPTLTSPMTGANVILGTAAYMAPEQARGKVVDRRADIWAFGCVLFECLTATRAFEGETVSDTLAKILEREPDLSRLPATTPARVRELIQRCLAKDARVRLRDIGDARIVLDEVLATRTSSGQLPVASVADVSSGSTRGSRFSPVAIATSLVAAAAIGAALWGTLAPRGRNATSDAPTCLSVALPAGMQIIETAITPDGGTVVLQARPIVADGATPAEPSLFTRAIGSYEFKELPGTSTALAFALDADSRSVTFIAPVSPGASQLRVSRMPLDGSAPATAVVDWKQPWTGLKPLEGGDLLVREGATSFFLLPRGGGAPTPTRKIVSGVQGVSRYEFNGGQIAGTASVFMSVVVYDARGWHHSVGVLDTKTGKAKVVEPDGGNAYWSPTGHMVFSRGDDVLAAPFDPRRMEVRGPAVAVWSGLAAPATFLPGKFELTKGGALFFRPGQLGAERPFVTVDAAGHIAPWSATPHPVDFQMFLSRDGRRLATQSINARGIDELWVSSVDHDDFVRVPTEPNADAFFPVWSPDGRQLAYRRLARDGNDGAYVVNIETGESRLVLKSPGESDIYDPNSWASDGTGLTLTHNVNGIATVCFLPVTAGGEWGTPKPLALGEGRSFLPLVSPDARTLAFQSDRDGKVQSYVVAFHGGEVSGPVLRVRTQGSDWHQWSADGRALYVLDDRRHLVKVPVTSGSPPSVGAATEYADLGKAQGAVWMVRPDGSVLVGQKNANEKDATQMNLVLGWASVLKKKPSAK
ncbi:MAG: serine/threonine-protein kinase [Candidatus Eisenbacteria bacterium]|nr:serine/threonine-protein kinase [Candidatus Eisenbacteria bacterium]